MAQADIVFRVDTEIEGQDKLQNYQDEITQRFAKMQSAVSGMQARVRDQAHEIEGAATKSRGAWERFSSFVTGEGEPAFRRLGNVVAGAFSVAAITSFVKAGAAAAVEQQDATNRLKEALRSQGVEVEANAARMVRYASAVQNATRFSDAQVVSAQALALRMGVAAEDTSRFTTMALDMSTALGREVEPTLTALAKAYHGNTGALSKFIPELKKLKDEGASTAEMMSFLQRRFAGAAQADVRTMGGAVAQLKNTYSDLQKELVLGFTGTTNMAEATRTLNLMLRDAIPVIRGFGQSLGAVAHFLAEIGRLGTRAFSFITGKELLNHTHDLNAELKAMKARYDELIDKRVKSGALDIDEANELRGLGVIMERTNAKIREQAAARDELAVRPFVPPGGGLGGTDFDTESAIAGQLERQARAAETVSALVATVPPEVLTVSAQAPEQEALRPTQGLGALGQLPEEIPVDPAEKLAGIQAETEARNLLSDSVGRQTLATIQAEAAAAREHAATLKQHAAQQRMTALRNMGTNAIGNMAGALIDAAISGEFNLKKMLKATLEGISQEAKVKAIMQLAEGFAALAMHDGAAAAMHFKSAAVFGAVAVASGIAANAIGGGEGGAGGEGGGRGGAGERDNSATVSAAQEPEQRGPTVQVTFTGNGVIAGTTPENFARAVQPYIEEVVAEAGGRGTTRR